MTKKNIKFYVNTRTQNINISPSTVISIEVTAEQNSQGKTEISGQIFLKKGTITPKDITLKAYDPVNDINHTAKIYGIAILDEEGNLFIAQAISPWQSKNKEKK